jgi:hypothetical protein
MIRRAIHPGHSALALADSPGAIRHSLKKVCHAGGTPELQYSIPLLSRSEPNFHPSILFSSISVLIGSDR